MVSPVDPNEIRLTGENSFIRLHNEPGGPLTARTSHWRVLLSPAGPGHILTIQCELTDNQIRIYSDNIALARWLQGEIEGVAPFADQSLPIVDAVFSRHGDFRSFSTEKIVSREGEISMTWYDLGDPFLVQLAAGTLSGRPHGIYTVIIPANKAQLVINGKVNPGRPVPEELSGHTSSTSSLAWSETWLRPR